MADKSKIKVEMGEAEISPWSVSVGDAEIVDPWELQYGETEFLDPWQLDIGEADMAPQESEVADPWTVGFGEPTLLGENEFFVRNPDENAGSLIFQLGDAEIKDPWSVK